MASFDERIVVGETMAVYREVLPAEGWVHSD